MKKESYKTFNLRNENLNKLKHNSFENKCYLLVKTYNGSLSKDKINNLNKFFESSNLILKSRYNFARDSHYLLKRKLDSYYPEYNTILEVYN